jgi:hypothetical protein
MSMSMLHLAAAAALALGATAAAGAANLLANGELVPAITNPTAPHLIYISGNLNSTALTGWTVSAGTIDVVPSSYWQNPPGMTWSVDLIGTPNAAGINAAGLGAIRQRVTSTVSGTPYLLSFDFSINPETFPGFPNELNTVKRLQVDVLGDDNLTVIATRTLEFARGARTLTNMLWTNETLDFTADGASTIIFRALTPGNMPTGLTGNTAFNGPVIGNVVLDLQGGGVDVPEPASAALLGAGGLLVLRRRRNA